MPIIKTGLFYLAVVVIVVVVMALILWGLDTFLGWLASMLIG